MHEPRFLMSQLHSSHCEGSSLCFHQDQDKDKCQKVLCHWFCQVQSPSSHPTSLVCVPSCILPRTPGSAAGPRQMIGPHGCCVEKMHEGMGRVHVTGMGGERWERGEIEMMIEIDIEIDRDRDDRD